MRMAMNNGQLLIKDASTEQFMIIKSWNKMKWSKAEQMLYAPVEIELLNKLAGIVRLPEPIEKVRQQLNKVAEAVDRERLREDPEPLYRFPVKLPLYKHQVRGVNMALMTFGLLEPPIEKKGGGENAKGKIPGGSERKEAMD